MEAAQAVDLEAVDPAVRLAVVKQFLTPWAYFMLVMIPVDLILVGWWAVEASDLVEIFATASFNEWLISAFALFGAGTFCVLVFRFFAALCEKYIGGEYSDGNNDHD